MFDNKELLESNGMNAAYCEGMLELFAENPNVVAFEADLMGASNTRKVKETYPDRVFDVGVAEANMICAAAGMSNCGKIPFCTTFAAFASRRDYDQAYISVAYAGLNVKIVGTDPGVAAENNGGTHMAFEDVGIMRTIPTMTVFEPCDSTQLKKGMKKMAETYGPFYMRIWRKPAYKIYDDNYEIEFGKADELRTGTDATVFAAGIEVWNAIDAYERLKKEGINISVVNMHTIKPIDEEAIKKAAATTGAIITAENNNYINGMGSAVAEVMVENDIYVPMERVGVKDRFGQVGTFDYLAKEYNIDTDDIVDAVKRVIARKKDK